MNFELHRCQFSNCDKPPIKFFKYELETMITHITNAFGICECHLYAYEKIKTHNFYIPITLEEAIVLEIMAS
jgi:hypothetical protein